MVALGIPPARILEGRSFDQHRRECRIPLVAPYSTAALGLANIRSVICLGNTWTAAALSP